MIERFCKDEKLDDVINIFNKLINKGYNFDFVLFMLVIDVLYKMGKKYEVDEFVERMLIMLSEEVTN